MQRAAVSVISNIAEGYERGSYAEFQRFLLIAKGSCAGLRSQLYVARDVGYIGQRCFDDMVLLAEEAARVISGLKTAVGRKRAPNA